MTSPIPYEQMTAAQKLRAYWHDRCDADPVPDEFDDEMEAAGYISARAVTDDDLDESFAYERGIFPGGMVWELTSAGRAALAEGSRNGKAK